jgi:hypothetical protein
LSLHARFRSLHDDEHGFALILAVSLITLVTLVSLSLITLTQGEDGKSRRDQAKDGAYQAAEAGTNAYLSDLTESNVFFKSWIARGEATRTDTGGVKHAGSNCTVYPTPVTCAAVGWSPVGSKWTYTTAPANDTGWFNLGNGYDYLIQIAPPDSTVTGLAQLITRIDVIGRPHDLPGKTDVTKWHTIETMIRPSSLTDFQAFLATSITYGPTATTTGPIFVGENAAGTPGNLTHQGIAQANLYAEGTVSSNILQNGARKYDKNSSPTALCKLNNCAAVPFSSFNSTITTVQGAAASSGGISLAATDPTNAALSSQSPAYTVDAWKLVFQSNGTVLVSSCKKYKVGSPAVISEVYDGSNPPVCGTAVSKAVPAIGAIYSAVDVLVSGAVKGRVTVATNADIIYGGSTSYVLGGTDVLGLEAYGEIYIAQWAPDATGNITIYSAQLALNGPWEADPNCNNTTQCHASSSTCNPAANCTMTFYGSSAIYGQSSSAISMAGMFDTRSYNYDNNLLFAPPPWFPTLGNAFTILVQREL